ncbi:MAG: site-2 protease family protein [Armatimonadota bacterium]|nr:site-2 protease family protein [Armatimonadota bacterium]MDR7520173.1 site-2 protease family protein [Armatimonadota bacterium]MDR7549248.1 site-2 protease family protein [Armatimonadota bacterium]
MIFGRDPSGLLLSVPAILVALTVHEYAHAWMADRLGDPTPRLQGRLTLNPIVHLDLLGTLLLLVAGFGWAKPVQVNPQYFPNVRGGMLAVAAAGPLSNVTLAFLAGALIQTGLMDRSTPMGGLGLVLIYFNVLLAVFNLLPVPPLDGSRILSALLPPDQALTYSRLAAYGPLLLLLLIMLPGRIFWSILGPPISWLIRLAAGPGAI